MVATTEVGEMVGLPDGIKRATTAATCEQMVDLLSGSDTAPANPSVINQDFTSATRSLSYFGALSLTDHGGPGAWLRLHRRS